MARKSLFKAFDQRTGRLERAINLVNDGQNPTLKTMRAEADRFNPQSLLRRIPPDRVHLKGGAFTPEVMTGRFVWMPGYTADSNFERPGTPAIVQGYNFARYVWTGDATDGGFGQQGFGYFGFGGIAEAGPVDGEII